MQSIDRIIAILESISIFAEGLGIAELHRSSSLPKSTLHRILTGLMKQGYVMQKKIIKI